ncbi:hypothetical protein AERO9AM_20254 [Aeromicrobium sp. 9AM]|nr:hypothetical protein AERO9AM_20254 [Aeromicrobium sp. 9AM]
MRVTTNVLTGPVPSVEVEVPNRENSHTGWTNPRGLDTGIADDALGTYVDDVIASKQSLVRPLARGRTAYWDGERHSVVIRDPASAHGGTVLRPDDGFDYFLGLD